MGLRRAAAAYVACAAAALAVCGAARVLPGLPTTRIVGGTPLPRNSTELSWVVSLQTHDGFHFCGGSLVAPKWVLTGWRCSGSGLDAKVVAGVVDLNDWRAAPGAAGRARGGQGRL